MSDGRLLLALLVCVAGRVPAACPSPVEESCVQEQVTQHRVALERAWRQGTLPQELRQEQQEEGKAA